MALVGDDVGTRQQMISEMTKRTTWLVLVVYLVVWTGLDFVAAEFEVTPGVSLWYPPAAVDVALLLIIGIRWAPALAATVMIHSAIVVGVGLHWWQVLILAIVTAISFGGAASALTRQLDVDPRLPTLRDVLLFGLMMCLIAPIPMAVVQVWLLDNAGAIDSQEFISGAAGFWAGAATGVGMLAPIALVMSRRWRNDADFDPDLPGSFMDGTSRIEVVGQGVALAGAVWVAFANDGGSLNYSYLIYAPLIWIGLRGGFFRAVVAVLAANIGAVALNGGEIPENGGFALQFGLVSLTLLGVTLGAAVSQRKADADRNLHASLRDPLTGLANRTLLNDRLSQVMSRRVQHADTSLGNGALLLLDLDRFKRINDSLGHGAGDHVLIDVAASLLTAVRDVDTVARLGGDEFAILLDGIRPDEVEMAAQRVLDSVVAPIETSAGTVHVTTSIGSVLIASTERTPNQTETTTDAIDRAERIIHRADIALHRAKQRGLNQHVPFDGEMHEQAVLRQSRESELRGALERDEIDVVFQPIVDIASRRLVAAEALARWTLPDGSSVDATDLIDAAEGSSQIVRLGRKVLRQACSAATAWPAVGQPVRVAVNVSALELREPGYAASVLCVLDEEGLAADRLELEITETKWISEVGDVMDDLAAAGIRLVLDDFGTGYSSLSYLHELPISAIKIDRSYVSTTDDDLRSVEIVKAILSVAAELGLEVTAEGVESESQWNLLRKHGCTRAQGYLLGRPAPGPPSIATSD